MTSPAFSVVVCTRHRPALLARCLASLARLEHPSYEVIVVDNTPGEREVEQLAADAGARYVVEPREGLSRARNTGAREARGWVVAYIDDDAVAERAWLGRHASALEDPALAATTGRILPTSLDAEAARIYAAAGGEDLGKIPFRVDPTTPAWFEMANFGGVGIGCNMAFKRELFETGWGFRESLGPGAGIPGEEHYAFFTIIRSGYSVAYLPDAVVYHNFPSTNSELRRLRSRILSGSVAYAAMLLVEEPEFRPDLLRYMRTATCGARRDWRRGAAEARLGNRLQRLAALCVGVPLYLRSLLTSGTGFSSPRFPTPTVENEKPRPSAPS